LEAKPMPKLTANERFYYNGRNVEMDETFVVDERDVDLLTHAVKPMARQPDRGEPEPEPEPEAKRADAKRPRATYKRRDMKAED
jgi:hypothetical protein